MKWFKFYGQDYLSDPKMLALNACQRSCWITLLSYGSVNDDGVISFLDEDQLMAQAGISPTHDDWDYTKGVLKKLEKLKMITIDDDKITICNWDKRQDSFLTDAERSKKYRDKAKSHEPRDERHAEVTLDKIRVDKSREDKEDMSDKSDVQVERFEDFDYFWEAYPKKELKRKAKEIWLRKKLSAQLKAILSFVEQAKQTDRWMKGYIKQPTAFLNGECWNDDLGSYNDKKAKQGIAIIS